MDLILMFDMHGERQLRQLLMDARGVTIDEFMSRFLFVFCQSRAFYGYLFGVNRFPGNERSFSGFLIIFNDCISVMVLFSLFTKE